MMPSGHKAFVVRNVNDVDLLLMHNKTFAAEYVYFAITRVMTDLANMIYHIFFITPLIFSILQHSKYRKLGEFFAIISKTYLDHTFFNFIVYLLSDTKLDIAAHVLPGWMS